MTEWIKVQSKSVYDADGFTTDYTWYKNEDGTKHIMMFGDEDIYEPDESYADVEFDSEQMAKIWFDNYKGFDSEEDLEESVDNKPVSIKVKYEVYDRTPNPQIKTGKVTGKDLYDALTSMFNHVNTYIDDKEDAEEQFKTADDITRYLEENNGDGCDYIIEIKDANTGEEYFSAYYEEDEDDWDNLDESLDEDETSDIILEIYEDETSDFPYTDEYQADAHFAELEQMTDPDLNGKGIIGYARLMRDDEGNFFLSDERYACDDSQIQLVDTAIDEFLGNKLNEAKSDAKSIDDAQKWVDYDMEKYGKISKKTNNLVKKAGYQIVKDDHGDYEVIAGDYDEDAANKQAEKNAKSRSRVAKFDSKTHSYKDKDKNADIKTKKAKADSDAYSDRSKSDTSRYVSKNATRVARDELTANRLKNKKDIEDIKSQIKKANLQKKLAKATATEELELNEAGKTGRYLVQVFDEGDWHDLNRWNDIRKAIDSGEKAVEASYIDFRVLDTEDDNTEIDIYDYVTEAFDDEFECTIKAKSDIDDLDNLDDIDSMDADAIENNESTDENNNLNESLADEFDEYIHIIHGSKRYEFDGTILTLTNYRTGHRVSLDMNNLDIDTFMEMYVEDDDAADVDLDECKTLKEDIDNVRPHHEDLLAAIEDGFVDYETVAKAALKFMSDDDIKELCRANDFNIEPADIEESVNDDLSIKEDTTVNVDSMNVNVDEVKVKNKDIQPDDIDDSFEMTEELTASFLENFKEEGKVKVISAEASNPDNATNDVNPDDELMVADMDFDDIDDIDIV